MEAFELELQDREWPLSLCECEGDTWISERLLWLQQVNGWRLKVEAALNCAPLRPHWGAGHEGE